MTKQFKQYPTGEGDFHYSDKGWFEYTGDWDDVAEGVRCRTFAFKGINAQETDGAFVEISPGHRTPVQLVKSEHAFVEVPFEGRFLFLHIDKKGAFTIRYFDGDSYRRGERGGEVFNEVNPNDLMSWYCLDDLPQNEIGKIVEYETPGFDSAELPTVTPESEELEGRNVPQEFWNAIELIDSGNGIELLNSHK